MTTSKGRSNMKNILVYLAVSFTLLNFVACSGDTENNLPTKTSAIIVINLTGILPIGISIAGADFTITLPVDVTPATTSGIVDSGVVSPSGTFAGGTQLPPIYTPATATTPGSLRVTLASSVLTGVSQVGEVATIAVQLANGATPTAASFVVSAVCVIDAALYNPISGVGANVANVTLQ